MNYEKQKTDFLMTIAFSVFGMLLVFGLGFVFPAINPYVVVKWIVIVCGVVFLYTFLAYLFSGLKALLKLRKKSKK